MQVRRGSPWSSLHISYTLHTIHYRIINTPEPKDKPNQTKPNQNNPTNPHSHNMPISFINHLQEC
jgi:hypothetical protein